MGEEAGGLLQGLDVIQYFLGVTGHFHPAPFASQDAGGVDDEGAAFNAPQLFAVHVLEFHDAEEIAGGFVRVGDEIEGQGLLGAEVVVGFDAVAGDAEHDGACGNEFVVQVTEVLAFGGAARGVVFRVKV